MTISELRTPAVLLDQRALLDNIKSYQEKATRHGKDLWPMTKTPKSSAIMRLQREAGARGVLCGTMDECEEAVKVGFNEVMYAYPFTDRMAIDRVISLQTKSHFYARIDSLEGAKLLQRALEDADGTMDYLLIVDVGLHRFGVEPSDAGRLVKEIQSCDRLVFKGLATHPGHVYQASRSEEVKACAEDEVEKISIAYDSVKAVGEHVAMISTGSTPTFSFELQSPLITHVHPGNYIFHDAIQMALGTATEQTTSLRVMASVISNPREGVYLMDAGAKCLGLDKGAHGNSSIRGHGVILNHKSAAIISVSEEVGVIHAPQGSLELGERIHIIPNHSCTVANLTSYLYLYDGETVTEVYEVDLRGNAKRKE